MSKATPKERLDVLLVAQGLFQSRERAKAAIMAGIILVQGQKIDKAGTMVPADCIITVLGADMPYVSRGGLKLEKAIHEFGIDLAAKAAMDIGASTGGFTDCMLQNGASLVYAIDVGYGQLDWKLRQDERVRVMERTNIRYIDVASFIPKPDFASIDVSFISLKLIFPVLERLLGDEAAFIALIKPQFEAGRENVGKRGVVRDPAIHRKVISDVWDQAETCGFSVHGLTYSPIKGPEGNIEYLLYCIKSTDGGLADKNDLIVETVTSAHGGLASKPG